MHSRTAGLKTKYRAYVDKLTIYPRLRWASLFAFVALHAWRVISLSQGKPDWQFAVVTYVLALSWVNHLFLFLSPAQSMEALENERFEREAQQDLEASQKADSNGLDFEIDPDNVKEDDEGEQQEYKPFERKILEMQLWQVLTKTTLGALFCTFFECFNLEIYAPLLIFYFIIITIFLCRVKIEHMIRYQYIPIDFGGKQKYVVKK